MKTKTMLTSLSFIAVLFIILSFGMKADVKNNDVKIDNNLYASVYEVTNKEYRAFLQDLKSKNKNEEYHLCIYDSTQWIKKFPYSYNEPMTNSYHSHPAYDNYPIVNITKAAADAYCKWQTEKYNTSSTKKYKKVVFRLPSEIEWKKLASPLAGHNLPWYGNFPYKSGEEKTFLTNIKVKNNVTGNNDYSCDGGVYTLIVEHYKANDLGVYDVIGNVAELTQSGTQKGGSWDNYLEECTIDKSQHFELPDPRVGFRVVMEVVEE
jgi:formylglycine-generating enzyme required for sulfatase activity